MNNHHNLIHWLVVVLIKTFYVLIFVPISIYTAAIGYIFAQNTLQSFLPYKFILPIQNLTAKLPYYYILENSIFSILGDLYINAKDWWGIIVGIPLILTAISIVIITLSDVFFALTNRAYNKTYCPFCA